MTRSIDYGNLMHQAMRGLIRSVLDDVAAHGLPGAHHFFITFDTTHPDVAIADWLKERYPTEMTVVLQHWFSGLEVTDEGFTVTLNFGNSPEPLVIPFDSVLTFVDPSVEFGLRFESQHDDDDEEDEADEREEEAEDAAPRRARRLKWSALISSARPEPKALIRRPEPDISPRACHPSVGMTRQAATGTAWAFTARDGRQRRHLWPSFRSAAR